MKMKQKKRLLNIMAVILIIAAMMTGCETKTKVDPFSYISVAYEGYNGNGSIRVDFDEDALIESIIGSEPESLDEIGEWLQKYDALYMAIDVSAEPNVGLSNGDVVVVTVTATGVAEDEVKSGSKEFSVDGLPEVNTVDVFEHIQLEYSGIVGGTTSVHLNRLSEEDWVRFCNFQVEPQSGIRNGDTITVTITNADRLAEEYLCVPVEVEKTFVVTGMDEYVTNPDLLPEDQIKAIIAQYIPASEEEDDWLYSYGEVKYYKTFLCIGKENAIMADFNQVQIFICYDQYMRGEYWRTVYVPLIFRDVVVSAEGEIDLNYEDGYTAVFYTDPDSMIEKIEEMYTVYEVDINY